MTVRRKRKRPAPLPPSPANGSPAQRQHCSSSSSNLTETSQPSLKADCHSDRTQSTSCLETKYYQNQSKESGLNIASLTGSELSLTPSNDDVFTESFSEDTSLIPRKLPYMNGLHGAASPRTNQRILTNHDQIEAYQQEKQRTQSASAVDDIQWGIVPIESNYVNISNLENDSNFGVLTSISNANNSDSDFNVYQSDTELQMCNRLYKQRRSNRNPDFFRLVNNSTPTSLCSFEEGSEYDFNCHSSPSSGKVRHLGLCTRFRYLSHKQAVMALASLHMCADLPEPSLFAYMKK